MLACSTATVPAAGSERGGTAMTLPLQISICHKCAQPEGRLPPPTWRTGSLRPSLQSAPHEGPSTSTTFPVADHRRSATCPGNSAPAGPPAHLARAGQRTVGRRRGQCPGDASDLRVMCGQPKPGANCREGEGSREGYEQLSSMPASHVHALPCQHPAQLAM